MYDPTIGRWLSEDPIKDGENWHAYVGNKPTTYVDQDGLNEVYFASNPVTGKIDVYFQDEFWWWGPNEGEPLYLGSMDPGDAREIVRRGGHTVTLTEVIAEARTWFYTTYDWGCWFAEHHHDFNKSTAGNMRMGATGETDRAQRAAEREARTTGVRPMQPRFKSEAEAAEREISQYSWDLLIFYLTAPAEVLQPLSQLKNVKSASQLQKAPGVIDARGWEEYEQGIRQLYGALPLSKRVAEGVLDGKAFKLQADDVAKIGKTQVAIEAKFCSDWGESIYNPASKVGQRPFTARLRAGQVQQARQYAAKFQWVIYHTNDADLMRYYSAQFREAGITNFRFILTP
ncbi:MAG: RHS repeat-associated core domain-containing protein [Planctomycetota bacterium]